MLYAFLTCAGSLLGQRPPAVALVSSDPYFSIWSMADQLNADTTRHWTGTPQSMTSLIRVDSFTIAMVSTTF